MWHKLLYFSIAFKVGQVDRLCDQATDNFSVLYDKLNICFGWYIACGSFYRFVSSLHQTYCHFHRLHGWYIMLLSVLVNDRRSSNFCKFPDFIVRFSRRNGFSRYAFVDRFHERNARINSQSARPVSFQILRARSACSGSTLVSKTTKAKVSANSGPDRRTKPI